MNKKEDREDIAKLDEVVKEEKKLHKEAAATKRALLESKYATEIQMFNNILQKYVYNRHKTKETLEFSIRKTNDHANSHDYEVTAVFDPKTCPEIKDLIRLRHLYYHDEQAWDTIVRRTKHVWHAQIFPEFKPCLGWLVDSCYIAPWALKYITLRVSMTITK